MPPPLHFAAVHRARLVRERAHDLREHPHVAAKALRKRAASPRRRRTRRARRARAPSDLPRTSIAFCSAGRRFATPVRIAASRSSRLSAPLSGGGKSCSNARRSSSRRFARDAFERGLDVEETMPSSEERLVALADLRGRYAEELALVALGEKRPASVTQVLGERARVGAEHAEHEVATPIVRRASLRASPLASRVVASRSAR